MLTMVGYGVLVCMYVAGFKSSYCHYKSITILFSLRQGSWGRACNMACKKKKKKRKISLYASKILQDVPVIVGVICM